MPAPALPVVAKKSKPAVDNDSDDESILKRAGDDDDDLESIGSGFTDLQRVSINSHRCWNIFLKSCLFSRQIKTKLSLQRAMATLPLQMQPRKRLQRRVNFPQLKSHPRMLPQRLPKLPKKSPRLPKSLPRQLLSQKLLLQNPKSLQRKLPRSLKSRPKNKQNRKMKLKQNLKLPKKARNLQKKKRKRLQLRLRKPLNLPSCLPLTKLWSSLPEAKT